METTIDDFSHMKIDIFNDFKFDKSEPDKTNLEKIKIEDIKKPEKKD